MAQAKKGSSSAPKKDENDKIDKLIEVLASKELRQVEKEEESKKAKAEKNKKLTEISTAKREKVKHRYATEPMITCYLEATADRITNVVDLRDPEDDDFLKNKKLKRYDSYGAPKATLCCGYRYYIPRGVTCSIPKSVYEMIEHSRDIKRKATNKVKEIQRARAKRMKSE